MTDIGFGMVDKRSVAAILFALVVASIFGLTIPISTNNIGGLLTDVVILTGALYISRTTLRLPFIVGIAIWKRDTSLKNVSELIYEENPERLRYEKYYKLIKWIRFFDRLSLIALVFLACIPSLKVFVTYTGALGLIVMLLVFVVSSSFSFLIKDAVDASKDREDELAQKTAASVTVTQPERWRDVG